MKRALNIIVGSKNPVKLNAAIAGTRRVFPDAEVKSCCVDAPSGVQTQPFGDEETKLGAGNRAKAAFSSYSGGLEEKLSFSVGIEGGVSLNEERKLECFAWVAVFDGKNIGYSRTAAFVLPPVMTKLVVDDGLELGDADDKVFGTTNSKQQGGTVGHLTNGAVDRTKYYEEAVVLAYIPFLYPDLYNSTVVYDD